MTSGTLYAFERLVVDQKKQSPDTIEVKGELLSYRTKRGIKRTYEAFLNFAQMVKKYPISGPNYHFERACTFYFVLVDEKKPNKTKPTTPRKTILKEE